MKKIQLLRKTKAVKEVVRLWLPLLLVLLSALYFGVKDYFATILFISGFLGLGAIFGHFFAKQIFGKYKWDVGDRLDIAWGRTGTIKHAMLAISMLLARVMVYVAVLIGLILATQLLTGSLAFGKMQDRYEKLVPILSEEADNIWPEVDKSIIAGQIQAESLWKKRAKRVEPNGVISYGLMQVCDRTFLGMRKKHKLLTDLEPVQMLQARYAIRAGLLYDKDMWNIAKCKDNDTVRYWWMLRAYNGGARLLNKEIKRAGSCDINEVAEQCRRKVYRYKWGTLDLCKVNTEYPLKIFKYAEKYRRYFQ